MSTASEVLDQSQFDTLSFAAKTEVLPVRYNEFRFGANYEDVTGADGSGGGRIDGEYPHGIRSSRAPGVYGSTGLTTWSGSISQRPRLESIPSPCTDTTSRKARSPLPWLFLVK